VTPGMGRLSSILMTLPDTVCTCPFAGRKINKKMPTSDILIFLKIGTINSFRFQG
jgi:hypothetical protein